jgi:heptosyltransferase II
MSGAATPPIERLVIRAPNWLGDAVLALPAMAAVRAQLAGAEITIAAPAGIAALFREDTIARPDRVLDLTDKHSEVTAALRHGGFDACLLFPNSFRAAWQARRAGIPHRWGYGTANRRWLLTRISRKPARGEARHQADYYRALVRGLDIPCDVSSSSALPLVRPTQASAARADALLRQLGVTDGDGLLAMMPGAAYGQAKQWPADRMAETAARLARDRGLRCVLLGASHDTPAARAIESWLRAHAPEQAGRVIDLVGRTSLGALAGVLDRAAVCVSNDSGGMHLAAALGRPVVAIFGPTDEQATAPLGSHTVLVEPVFCRPCQLRDCPIDHRCMKRISVQRVFDAVAARLEPIS